MTKAIVITAHHDDAVLWVGGTILRTIPLGWEWTVIALCISDEQKMSYLASYCDTIGARMAAFRHADYQGGGIFSRNSMDNFQRDISAASQGIKYDWVFTHSREPEGEYPCPNPESFVGDGLLLPEPFISRV